MTGKLVSGIVAMIALLGLSATAAQAGSGGIPSALTSFFVCKSINGDDAGQHVDVESFDSSGAGWGFTLSNVRLGNATLACAFARLFPGRSTTRTPCISPGNPSGCNEITPKPVVAGEPLSGGHLKCYSVSVNRGQTGNPTPPSYTVTDGLVGTDPNVAGSSLQYVCAPAQFLQNLP